MIARMTVPTPSPNLDSEGDVQPDAAGWTDDQLEELRLAVRGMAPDQFGPLQLSATDAVFQGIVRKDAAFRKSLAAVGLNWDGTAPEEVQGDA